MAAIGVYVLWPDVPWRIWRPPLQNWRLVDNTFHRILETPFLKSVCKADFHARCRSEAHGKVTLFSLPFYTGLGLGHLGHLGTGGNWGKLGEPVGFKKI